MKKREKTRFWSYITSAGLAATILTTPLPAQAAETLEPIAGTLVAEVQSGSEVLAVPSATPSDDGKILVTWYGDAGATCQYPYTGVLPPICKPYGRVVNAAGEAVSAIFGLGGETAPYYYGAPYSTWSPEGNEWIAYWTSYADEQDNTEFGLKLRRISSDGIPLGAVIETPVSAIDPSDNTIITELQDAANPSLVWLEDRKEWILFSYMESNGPDFVAYLRLTADLELISDRWVVISTASGSPYLIQSSVAADGSIGVIYRRSSPSDLVFRRLIVGQDVQFSPETVLVPAGALASVGFSLAYIESSDSFIATYRRGQTQLRSVVFPVSDSPVAQDRLLLDYATVDQNQFGFSFTSIQRNYAVVNEVDGLLHVAQNARTDEPQGYAAVNLTFDLSDLSLQSIGLFEEGIERTDGNGDRPAGRPVLSQTGGSIAFAYYSWENEFQPSNNINSKQFVRAGMLVLGAPTELQPVPYTGPSVTNDPATAQSGSTVTYQGSGLSGLLSATIAGQSAAIVSKSAGSLTLRVPAGLTQGMHDVVLHYSSTESVTLQNGLIVQDLMKVWTQLQSDNTVKMYAKNIIGEGKIQFRHNNREIAWVRATNALNPKLRQANGSSYLVRTRALVDGKNAFEIYQDGKRIWRAAYTNR